MARDRTLDALHDLLDRERGLILAGRITELGRLNDERQRLVGALHRSGAAPELEALRSKAARNGLLLEAAASGVRAAIARLAGIREAAAHLDTYSPDGGRVAHPSGRRSLERRA